MPPVADIQNRLLTVLSDCRSLFTHSRNPVAQHTPAGVESAFLEAFKAWEVFLEELTLAYLMGEPDITGNPAPVAMTVVDEETCRKIISGGRSYVSWSNPDDVRRRFSIYFLPSSLDQKLNASITDLRDCLTCRNAIAHSSGSAYDELSKLWTKITGTAIASLRTADVLQLPYVQNPPLTWFDRYLEIFDVSSNVLVTI